MHSFYRVKVVNLHKISDQQPTIMVSNHPNGLMDGIIPVFSQKAQVYFLSRADIFDKPFLIRLFLSFKMKPVFRRRDGVNTVEANKPIFDWCVNMLSTGATLLIFPEGSHEVEKRLRRMKKGAARIAFATEAANNFQLGLQILPCGLNYDNPDQARSKVCVSYGQPIQVAEYQQMYEKDKEKAIELLMEEVRKRISQLTVDIADEANYASIAELINFFKPIQVAQWHLHQGNAHHEFMAEQQLANQFVEEVKTNPNTFEEKTKALNNYQSLLDKYQLSHHTVFNQPKRAKYWQNTLLLLLGFPLFSYGVINNFLPWNMANWYGKKRIKTAKLHVSAIFTLLIITFPIFYGLQSLFVSSLIGSGWITLAYLFTLPLTGFFAARYGRFLKKTVMMGRFLKLNEQQQQSIMGQYERLKTKKHD